MNSLTDCFTSGIHHVVELCHSRLVILLPVFFFDNNKLIKRRTWFPV